MGLGLSVLGVFHTLIGIVAIIAAVISYVKFGKINLAQTAGKIYFHFTIFTSLSSLGLLKNGFNPGHVFALFIVVLVVVAYVLHTRKRGNNTSRYLENILLSFSFFLSWVPTINETFTRVPIGRPLAEAPTDPIIGLTLLVFFVLFVIGSVVQYRVQRRLNLGARIG